MKRLIPALIALSVTATLAGCSTYYRVSAPDGEEVYYTKKSDLNRRGAAIEFKDQRTGRIVTMSNSVREEISKEEFRSATGTH